METVKETKEYKILKKRSGRYAVKTLRGKWVNGVEKAKILVDAGLVKTGLPKPEEAAPAEEPAAAAEAPAEEAAAE